MSENSNEIEFEDLMNKGTSEFSYADIQWLKGYAHTFCLQLEDIKKELINQDKYIEQLKKEYDKVLQQKENIIKEVREYVEKCSILGVNEVDSYCMDYDVRDDLLRILDKENKQ